MIRFGLSHGAAPTTTAVLRRTILIDRGATRIEGTP